jgi:trimeric autotransporter adhesin
MKRLTLLLFVCVYSTGLYSQNITNTLGASGLFTIKDVSNNYLTLDQSTGRMNILRTLGLEYTTSPELGVIFKGNERFIHNYGTNNTFIGINSGNFSMTGNTNTAVGVQSLISNTEGYWNTALGGNSLYNNLSGYQNTAIGYATLQMNTTGRDNTALGVYSLPFCTSGSENISLGVFSLYSNTEGSQNTSTGVRSLFSNTTGSCNTASGYYSMFSNTIGSYNTAFGYNSLYSMISGQANTAIGYGAGSGITTGGLLTCLGHKAGSTITTGVNLTCVGDDAQPSSPSATNEITLGSSDVTVLRSYAPSLTSLSDARDKKNIKDLSLGLDFILKLKPRQFNWDKREWYGNNKSDGSRMKEQPTAGFIAQELNDVQTTEKAEWLNLVLKNNPDKWEATPGNLLPIMVKAIQELKKENNDLKNRLTIFEQVQNMLVAEIEKVKTNNNKTVIMSSSEK